MRIMFVFGPSGVGKSSLGQYLDANRSWLHLEADPLVGDGIDLLGLRQEWNTFLFDDTIAPLIHELRARLTTVKMTGCVLTLSGGFLPTEAQFRSIEDAGIQIVCLYGEETHCFKAFKAREMRNSRNLPPSHWHIYNPPTYEWMQKEYVKDFLIPAFDIDGNRIETAALVDSIEQRAGRAAGRIVIR